MTIARSPPAQIKPFDAVMISVGDGHWIYAEQVGAPAGVPMVFLHGGPGSGAQHSHRALFDPAHHHAILFDQRGSGRSHPYRSTHANTTAHLIADLEALRQFFGFEKWLVVGGSWGSTLALAYAEAYPERVSALVLRAVFLASDEEIQWAFVEGPRRFRPELFGAFAGFLPRDEQADPIAAYVKRLTSKDPAVHGPAAQMWNDYERALSELAPSRAVLPTSFGEGARIAPTPLMEAHYIKNHFFLERGALLAGAHKLKGIPGHIVQGRYDLLCPPSTAETLAKAWPECHLEICETAGHAMTEPGIEAAMTKAIAALAKPSRF